MRDTRCHGQRINTRIRPPNRPHVALDPWRERCAQPPRFRAMVPACMAAQWTMVAATVAAALPLGAYDAAFAQDIERGEGCAEASKKELPQM